MNHLHFVKAIPTVVPVGTLNQFRLKTAIPFQPLLLNDPWPAPPGVFLARSLYRHSAVSPHFLFVELVLCTFEEHLEIG